MTTYKPYQYFTLLSDIRYPTSDILPFLPQAMDPVRAATRTLSQVYNLSGVAFGED